MGSVAFALHIISMGLSALNETASAFNRHILSDGRQLALYGVALLFTFLPTRLPFLQEFFGLTSLTGEQWVLAIVLAFGLLLVDEVVKFILHRNLK